MPESALRYVAVEGPIGVGKTSLAERLAQSYGSELILEQPEDNPFLERFYKDPKSGALPVQLHFLFQRAQQLQDLKQEDMFRPVQVADYLLEKDRLFAGITLDADEFGLYDQVYQRFALDVPQPDLVIYLQAPVETLLKRIRGRGIDYEQRMSPEYLSRVCESYMQFFYNYNSSPLLIVNAEEIDLVNRETDFSLLLERIEQTTSGRHYFNPQPIT